MPKEKNSALAAIGPAFTAARGTSIMVPIRVCTWVPVSSSTSLSTFSVRSRHDLQFLHGADERDHHLGPRVLARLLELGGGVRDRAHLHARTGPG